MGGGEKVRQTQELRKRKDRRGLVSQSPSVGHGLFLCQELTLRGTRQALELLIASETINKTEKRLVPKVFVNIGYKELRSSFV